MKVGFVREIVERFHGAEAGWKAETDFEQRFAKKELNAEVLEQREVSLGGAAKLPLAKLLVDARLADSNTKARTLITRGGVRVDSEKTTDTKAELCAGDYVVQVGKLKAARVRVR